MVRLEGGDISIDDFLQEQHDFTSTGSLQKTFHNSSILLTGATGFLGSLVLEKLLRSCGEVAKVFVTVRSKQGKTARQRLKELFSTKMFDRVKMENRGALEKVELVDLDLGLESHSVIVTSSVDIIIHCALVTDPGHSLREAVDTNIKYTSAILQMAYSCSRLEAFVVVSSTMCHFQERVVEERFYPPPVGAKAMCIICDTLPENVYNTDTTGLILANTCASLVTLSIAEDIFRQGRKTLPIALVRPSMLVGSYQEPLAGWLPPSPRGLMQLLSEAVQGRLCTLKVDTSLRAELTPADLAANLTLAVAAHTAAARRNWQNKEIGNSEDIGGILTDSDISIYNLVSSTQSQVSWWEFFVCSIRHARTVPFLKTAWYPHLNLTTSKFSFSLWFYFLHLLPAWLMDSFQAATESSHIINTKQSRVYQKYKRLRECCEGVAPYMMTSQHYKDHNTQALWRSLTVADKSTFSYHTSQVDWDEYLYTLARGVRLYCLEDSLDTIPRAANRLKRLKLLHYGCVVMASFIVLIVVRALIITLLF